MFAPDLFADSPRPDLLCEAQFLPVDEHVMLFDWCDKNVPWRQMSVNFRGKEVPVPRVLAWYGDVDYHYSGLHHPAKPMPQPLRDVANRIEAWLTRHGRTAQFNSVLMNYYRDGNDSIGLHADDETQLGRHPTIASVSLGAARTFEFRHRSLPLKLEEQLTSGSLLVMLGDTQEQWRHGIPKEPTRTGARINLTFRNTLR